MVSILQCPNSPKQVFVAKYLFLEQGKQIWDEPLCCGHLSIADTFSQSQWCPLQRGFTVIYRMISIILSMISPQIRLSVNQISSRVIIYKFHKTFGKLFRFSHSFFRRRSSKTRLLSPGSECTSCLQSQVRL